jgi:hypothetical protein
MQNKARHCACFIYIYSYIHLVTMFSTRSVFNLLPGRFHHQHAMHFFFKTESCTYIKREQRFYLVALNFAFRNLEYIRMVFCFHFYSFSSFY